MTDSTCKIEQTTGNAKVSLADFLRQRDDSPTALVWLEPDPRAVNLEKDTGRRCDEPPLTVGLPNWLSAGNGPPVIEARLFWASEALHVVANPDGTGCRWAFIKEKRPADDSLPKISAPETSDKNQQVSREVHREEYRVRTIQDLDRFGFDKSQSTFNLKMFEYRVGGRLVAWRLVREDNDGGNI